MLTSVFVYISAFTLAITPTLCAIIHKKCVFGPSPDYNAPIVRIFTKRLDVLSFVQTAPCYWNIALLTISLPNSLLSEHHKSFQNYFWRILGPVFDYARSG